MDNYKELQKRVSLMHDADWVRTIGFLKESKLDDKLNYRVVYREEKQRKNRSFSFHSVQFVEETSSFVFTAHVLDWQNSDVTSEVRDRITLKDIEIIKYDTSEKITALDLSEFI